MDFFEIGPGEILLIIIVALIIWGPERLVEVARTLGKTVHSFRKATTDLTAQVTKEIEEEKAAIKPLLEIELDPPPQRKEKTATTPRSEDGSKA